MRRLLIATILAGVLVPAGAAQAGCWATVGLAPPPAHVEPGGTWTAQMTVLQHGRTPLPDAAAARPTLTIRNADTGVTRTFTARPTADPTVFTARVVFPSAGRWRYEVFDDFTSWEGEPAPCAQTHTFAAVEIGPSGGGSSSGTPTPPAQEPVAAAAETGGGFPVWRVAAGVAAGLVAGAAAVFALRRRRELTVR